MPTENPRVTITMTEEQLNEIREYLYSHKMKNQTQAILSLISKGFDALNFESSNYSNNSPYTESKQKAPADSANALEHQLVDNFRAMNNQGQNILCELSGAMRDSKRYDSEHVVSFVAHNGQKLSLIM